MKAIRPLLLMTVLALLLGAVPALAEVSVRTDRGGNYIMTHVLPGGNAENPLIWGQGRFRAARFGGQPLNVDGDRNGDLWPAVAESPVAPHYPMVVWSRFNGLSYHLAWSRWTEAGWDPIRWVTRRAPGEHFDPFVAFNPEGRPLMVWWRAAPSGRGEIFISMFLENRWAKPVLVSDPSVDARYPTLEITGRRELLVRYEADGKRAQKIVSFSHPGTITDDINPTFTFTGGIMTIAPRKNYR